MKKIFLIIFMIISLSSFSQINDKFDFRIDYPIIKTDTLGKKIVILTLEQAKYVDNRLDILNLLEKSNELTNDIDSVFIKIINEKEKVIANQGIKINKMDSLLVNKDEQVDNLKKQILLYQMSESTYILELENKNSEIDLHLDRIDKLEKKNLSKGFRNPR